MLLEGVKQQKECSMKKICFLIFFTNFVSQISFANECDKLIDSIKIDVYSSHLKVNAGDKVILPVSIRVENYDSLSEWKSAAILVVSDNNIIGSSLMDAWIDLADAASLIEMQSKDHMGGNYRFSLSLQARGHPSYSKYCLKNFDALNAFTLEVQNTPEKIDITPPKISQVSFRRNVYTIGETISIDFVLEDENAICTKDLIEMPTPVCEAISHVKLTSTSNLEKEYHFSPQLVKTGKNTYAVDLNPSDAKDAIRAGVYRLEILNNYDIHGNGDPRVPENEKAKVILMAPSNLEVDVTGSFRDFVAYTDVISDLKFLEEFKSYIKWLSSLKVRDAELTAKWIENNDRSLIAMATIFHEQIELMGWLKLGHKIEDIMNVEYFQNHYEEVYPIAHKEAIVQEMLLLEHFAAEKGYDNIPELTFTLVSPLLEIFGVEVKKMTYRLRYNSEQLTQIVTEEDLNRVAELFKEGGYVYQDKDKVISDALRYLQER